MIEALSQVATAFGLSTSAGLNAYVPLLIVALMARFTSLIRLNPPFNTLTSGWVILVLAILLAIEIVADKIPVVDSINDVIQTIVRPAAGAVLFAASTNAIGHLHPVLAMCCGLILAGGVHAAKATARPVITATTGGLGNAVVSTAEDVTSGVVSVLAIVVPALMVAVILAIVAFILWRRGRRQSPAG